MGFTGIAAHMDFLWWNALWGTGGVMEEWVSQTIKQTDGYIGIWCMCGLPLESTRPVICMNCSSFGTMWLWCNKTLTLAGTWSSSDLEKMRNCLEDEKTINSLYQPPHKLILDRLYPTPHGNDHMMTTWPLIEHRFFPQNKGSLSLKSSKKS